MYRALDFLTNFDYLYPLQTILESLWHADWKCAFHRDGVAGLFMETLCSLVGVNSHQFHVPMNRGWSGHSIQRLLAKYGIPMWGWSFANGEMFFRVKSKQAAWAQYVMLNDGVPLQGHSPAAVPSANGRPSESGWVGQSPPPAARNSPMADSWQKLDSVIQRFLSDME